VHSFVTSIVIQEILGITYNAFTYSGLPLSSAQKEHKVVYF